MRKRTETASDRLAELALSWRVGRNRTQVVPVVGTGLNIQAAFEARGAREHNWDRLMKDLAKTAGASRVNVDRLPKSFIQQWEAIVRWYRASEPDTKPHHREEDLLGTVCDFVRKLEARSGGYPLFEKFAKAGFTDIISLNFDRRLALSLGCKSVVCKQKNLGVHSRPLFRFSLGKYRVPTAEADSRRTQQVRIWYPHGDSKRKDTIKLGVRRYGVYIAEMDRMRGRYMEAWQKVNRSLREREGYAMTPKEWDRHVRENAELQSWACVFMSAPLLFIGCGLGVDEWPLWWLLNQRARQTSYLDRQDHRLRPDTVVLSAGENGPPEHLQGELCYIENLHFSSHADMWEAIHHSVL